MQDIQIIPSTAADTEEMIIIMRILSNYFSPETIDFAEEKIPQTQGYIARDKDKMIGFITFEKIADDTAKIFWMAITPEHQHQGIGSQLLTQTEKSLAAQGITTIELLTLDEHPDYPGYLFTRNFYKKHGFEIKDAYQEDDVTILRMAKPLQ